MEYDLYNLNRHIDAYFQGRCSRSELGAWGKEAYYDLLTGGYIEQKKLVLYPFLKTISQFHLEENDSLDVYPSTVEKIRAIQRILQGKQAYSYQIVLSLPPRFQPPSTPLWERAKRAVDTLLRTSAYPDDFASLMDSILQLPRSDRTLFDFLQREIVTFCSASWDTDTSSFQAPLRLYAHRSDSDTRLLKLRDLLACYTGSQNLICLISYEGGEPTLQLFF